MRQKPEKSRKGLEKLPKTGDYSDMTDFLFAQPSFLEGIGRNMDLFGVLNHYNDASSEHDADKIALASDWMAVYNDLYKAFYDTKCQLETRTNAI